MKVVRTKNIDMQDLLSRLENKVAKVGWYEKQKYPNGQFVAAIAAQNEKSNPNKNIPARPFMRPTIIAETNNWMRLVEQGAKQILKGNYNTTDVLDLLGQKAAGDIRETISKVFEPPLATATIKARLAKRKNKTQVGNLDKPLIDTGYMFATLNSTVEDE